MAKIISVQKGGIGEEIGLEAGDELLGFNGEKIVDVLDYAYYDSQEEFVINILTKQGEKVDIDLFIIVEYGISISAVAASIIETVKYKVEHLTGISVGRVNVCVEDIRV